MLLLIEVEVSDDLDITGTDASDVAAEVFSAFDNGEPIELPRLCNFAGHDVSFRSARWA